MKRVLVILRYPPPETQSEQRGPIYTELFREIGCHVEYVWRYPYAALGRKESVGSAAVRTMRGAFGGTVTRSVLGIFNPLSDRALARKAAAADVVLLVQVDSVELVRLLRMRTRARIVYDLADVRPSESARNAALEAILPAVDAVTVDNSAGEAFARRFNASVHVWPPLSYIEAFDEHRARVGPRDPAHLVIGWVGSPSTAASLYLLVEPLEDVFRKNAGVELRLVGIPSGHDLLRRFESVRFTTRSFYDRRGMIEEVASMHVGLYPNYDLQLSAMHGITKALIYMAGGAVPICSPVGDVRSFVVDGRNGFLARSRGEWADRLGALISDPMLRQEMTAAAHETASAFSLRRCFESLRPALQV